MWRPRLAEASNGHSVAAFTRHPYPYTAHTIHRQKEGLFVAKLLVKGGADQGGRAWRLLVQQSFTPQASPLPRQHIHVHDAALPTAGQKGLQAPRSDVCREEHEPCAEARNAEPRLQSCSQTKTHPPSSAPPPIRHDRAPTHTRTSHGRGLQGVSGGEEGGEGRDGSDPVDQARPKVPDAHTRGPR